MKNVKLTKSIFEEYFTSYDIEKYPFGDVLNNLFNLNSLEKLHTEVSSLKGFNGDVGKDSQSLIHNTFYNNIKNEESELRKLWDKFLVNVVLKNYKSKEKFIVQKLPNIRIHIPGAKAINRWHCDSDKDHNHPIGEINCILPLTKMYGSNSVWRESRPQLGDFLPFELNVGDLVYWNGNTCIHGNKVNETDMTRVSFDFRIISRDNYDNMVLKQLNKNVKTATMGTKFLIGAYYKEI